jgi:TldD protein
MISLFEDKPTCALGYAIMQRRDFMKTCTGATLAVATPGVWHSVWSRRSQSLIPSPDTASVTTLYDPSVRALALSALDASKSAGAQYADVRLTNTTYRYFGSTVTQTVTLGMSVRALVNGYWGWAATPVLATSEAGRVGQLATAQATVSATRGKPRNVELGTGLVTHNGDWSSPGVTDPFNIPVPEVHDWLEALARYIRELRQSRGHQVGTTLIGVSFQKEERLFASTEGSLCTQTVFITAPNIGFKYRGIETQVPYYNFPVQAGWERLGRMPVHEMIRQEMDRIDAMLAHPLPVKPVEVGRYDLVLTAGAMAKILTATLGRATELDRALGYEANASGTSYLGPHPLTLLGTSIASPLVTVTANRSTPQGVATVQWDDEGVIPHDFTLVNKGVLVDYQTTREQAQWLAPWYEKQGRPLQSHGCAGAQTALAVTMQHTPNLALEPGTTDQDIDALVAELDHGLVVEDLGVSIDFQCLNGLGLLGGVTEVRQGKRIARIDGAGLLFRSPEFWKNLEALGGPKSAHLLGGFSSNKGDPNQQTGYSVSAVPARVKQQAIIDPTRKA